MFRTSRIPPARRSIRKKTAWFLIVVVALFVVGKEFGYRSDLSETASDRRTEIRFEVAAGSSAAEIADDLVERGIVVSAKSFKKFVQRNSLESSFRSGTFVLSSNETIPAITDILTQESASQIVVTIREGLSVDEVDTYLSEKVGLLASGSFKKCAQNCSFDFDFLASKPANIDLEGYLFPDTYFFDPDASDARTVISKMLVNFGRKISKIEPIGRAAGHSTHELATMASLVEEESRHGDERAVIAGILWKRFDAGIGLDVDATIRYAVGKISEPLTRADLATDSPWNTRKWRGLPPGPIAGFGESSLNAAANPVESEWWYYLHDPSGQIHFAKDLDGHNANVAEFLR